MEFVGMPPTWIDYYRQGFQSIAQSLGGHVSDEDIDLSVEIMKAYNPRVNYREIEYTPEFIFEKALKHWDKGIELEKAIKTFFDGLNLNTIIYNDTIDMLKCLKENRYIICALTDIPSAMPDAYFKSTIENLLPYIDFYVSSQSCGYRKPNTHGIQLIADKYTTDIKNLIFVGDEEKDKKLAQKVGCSFYLIDRKNENSAADIHNMSELKFILKLYDKK